MIQQISDLCITLSETVSIHATVLHGLAAQFDALRSVVVDTAVARDQEQAKRNLISELDAASENIRIAVGFLEHGPLTSEALSKEIREALCLRVKELAGAAALSEVVEILSERANNIAAAYRGRVAREPE